MWKFIVLLVAVVGSLAAANAQEAEDSKTTLFHNFDTNKDGFLTREEVGTTDLGLQHFERLLTIADKNQDGKIVLREFLQGLNSKETSADDPRPAETLDAPRDRQSFSAAAVIFSRFDQNKDGRLELGELPEAFQARLGVAYSTLGKNSMSKEEFETAYGVLVQESRELAGLPEANAFFGKYDANKDDKITIDEVPEQYQEILQKFLDRFNVEFITRDAYQRLVERSRRPDDQTRPEQQPETPPETARETQKERPDTMRRPGEPAEPRRGPAFFAALDTDRDGKLSADELSRASQLVASLDRNEDGLLDPAEMFGLSLAPAERERRGEPDGGRSNVTDRPSERPQRPSIDENPKGTTVETPQLTPAQTEPSPAAIRAASDAEFAAQFIVRFDEDRDGKLSAEEAPDQLRKNFERIDLDADGAVTKDELTKAFARSNR